MLDLTTPIEKSPRITLSLAAKLKRLGIKTERDLLFHFPSRYDDFSNQKTINDIIAGETATINGVIKKISNIRTFRKRMFITEAVIEDGTGQIKSVWFNQPFLAKILKTGQNLSLSGKIATGPKGLYLQNPSYEKSGNLPRGIHTGGFVAVYPETEGLTSRWIRFLINNLIFLSAQVKDILPEETLYRQNLWNISRALWAIHFPKSKDDIKKAQRRFVFEEMLMMQLRTIKEKIKLKEKKSPQIKPNIDLIKKFVQSLNFQLTDAQRRSLWEIMQDISKPRPMNRLLEGDVGSGKTVVAAASSLLTAKCGYQIAYLAPTEILASQHFSTFKKLLSSFGVSIGLCTASQKKCLIAGYTSEKILSPKLIEDGSLDIIIGTHAILNDKIKFKNLGLIIIDEQHRFGVEQRAKLAKRESTETPAFLPHFLSMTATPIPRTLALTVYGDLDISLLNELPKNRKEIITKVVPPEKRNEAYDFIRQEVRMSGQVFVICPRIEIPEQETPLRQDFRRRQGFGGQVGGQTNNKRQGIKYQQKFLQAEIKAVKEEYKKLAEKTFPDLRVAMLHGKMKPKEKELIMEKFSGANGKHEIDILVSTSVVEVGVDIPNATIMMIEGAEKFGLSQLHQFRGRIGRGEKPSYCFLFTTGGIEAGRRLRAVAETKNGFELAEKDLEIRGPGDLFGIRQSGVPDIVLKNLDDHKLIRDAKQEAIILMQKDSSLKKYPPLLKRLEEMERMVHFE